LIQVRISCKKSVLNRIFGVRCIAQEAIRSSVERWQAAGQNLPEFLTHDLPWNFGGFASLDGCVCTLHARALLSREQGTRGSNPWAHEYRAF
jgi:hypothetical protein